jgi:tetratricopeptide (TPR) repeat protein
VSGGVAPLVERAEAARAAGDLDSAVAKYDEAYARTPWNTRLREALVATHADRAARARKKPGGARGLAAAEKDLRAARALAPDDAGVARSLAAVLLERAAFEADDDLSAKLRLEANTLAPELAAQSPPVRLPVERRLDLGYSLIEQGQLDAGIDQLETVVHAYPNNTAAARLLAQALVRKGDEDTRRLDHDGARGAFSEAVQLYARLAPCDGTRCDRAELELAHRNRIVCELDAERFDAARAALADAQAAGLQFDDLVRQWPELAAPH